MPSGEQNCTSQYSDYMSPPTQNFHPKKAQEEQEAQEEPEEPEEQEEEEPVQ